MHQLNLWSLFRRTLSVLSAAEFNKKKEKSKQYFSNFAIALCFVFSLKGVSIVLLQHILYVKMSREHKDFDISPFPSPAFYSAVKGFCLFHWHLASASTSFICSLFVDNAARVTPVSSVFLFFSSRWNRGTRWTALRSSLTPRPTNWFSWTSCSPEQWCLARCEPASTSSLIYSATSLHRCSTATNTVPPAASSHLVMHS